MTFIEDTNSDQSSEKGVTFEEPLWVFVFKGQQVSGGFSDLGQQHLDSPDFFFVLEAELSDEFQLGVESFLLEGSFWGDISLVVMLAFNGWHGIRLINSKINISEIPFLKCSTNCGKMIKF